MFKLYLTSKAPLALNWDEEKEAEKQNPHRLRTDEEGFF